jgi:hypothetical protein
MTNPRCRQCGLPLALDEAPERSPPVRAADNLGLWFIAVLATLVVAGEWAEKKGPSDDR